MEILGLHSGVRCTTFFLFAFQPCPGTFRGRWGEPKLRSLASKSPEASELGTGHSSHSRDIGLHLNFNPFSFFLPVTPAKWIILTCPSHSQPFQNKLTSWREGSFGGSPSHADVLRTNMKPMTLDLPESTREPPHPRQRVLWAKTHTCCRCKVDFPCEIVPDAPTWTDSFATWP